jgi:predicted MFS family arabinose efflux permease
MAERLPRARVAVIAMGLLVTGLGWPSLIGRLPFGLLLKNELHLPAQKVAAFWAIATFAWYVKPLVGLVCDAYPLFGTRRRGYLLLGGLASTLMWLAFAAVPRTYAALLGVMVALNVALVVISTVVGGLLVETGQRHGATGRLSSLRMGLMGLISLIAGPLGGWLATRAFGWTVGVGTAFVAGIVPVVLLLEREGGGARADASAWVAARSQLRTIVRSRAMLSTAALVFLAYVAPGFQTALLYYQQDVLEFDPGLMGLLDMVAGGSALLGAVVYGLVCRRFSLRTLLVGGIALNAAATLLYLFYRSSTSAFAVNAIGGGLAAFSYLPLYDLAARATPRGSESFGYALIISVENVAIYAVSNVLGAYLYGSLHWPWDRLVWVNALSTAAVLLFVPILPAVLLARSEGQAAETSA